MILFSNFCQNPNASLSSGYSPAYYLPNSAFKTLRTKTSSRSHGAFIMFLLSLSPVPLCLHVQYDILSYQNPKCIWDDLIYRFPICPTEWKTLFLTEWVALCMLRCHTDSPDCGGLDVLRDEIIINIIAGKHNKSLMGRGFSSCVFV